MTMIKTLIPCALLMLLAGTVDAATWRCDRAIASTGDTHGRSTGDICRAPAVVFANFTQAETTILLAELS